MSTNWIYVSLYILWLCFVSIFVFSLRFVLFAWSSRVESARLFVAVRFFMVIIDMETIYWQQQRRCRFERGSESITRRMKLLSVRLLLSLPNVEKFHKNWTWRGGDHEKRWKKMKEMVRMQIKINWPFIYHFSRIFCRCRTQATCSNSPTTQKKTERKMSKRSQRRKVKWELKMSVIYFVNTTF